MTGQKTWAVGEEVLAPDFNNYVQTQVVAQFANAAARDAWGSPPDGALCVTLDNNMLFQRIAGAWVAIKQSGGGGPYGINFYVATLPGNLTITTTAQFACTVNVPALPAGSLVSARAMIYTSIAVGIGNGYFGIRVNGTAVGMTCVQPDISAVFSNTTFCAPVTAPVGAAFNCDISCSKAAAGGTCTLVAARLEIVTYRP